MKSLQQLSIEESHDRVRVWDINDARARKVHQRIGEMVALDMQPFSIIRMTDLLV